MTDDLDRLERTIREHSDPVVTASELAEDLGCSPRHALELLRVLERTGEVSSKKVGARAIAWWHTDRIREDSPGSFEMATNEQPMDDQRTTSEPVESEVEELTEESEEPTDPIEQAIDRAAIRWDDTPKRIEQRKQAARAVLESIREQPMSKSEVLDEIEPRHSVEGQSKRTWWRNLTECDPSPLKELAMYSNATKKWEWTGR